MRLGLPICEDIWGEEVVECLAETGAEMLVVPNGSPYWRDKGDVRLNIAVARVTEQGLPMVYVNQVGGQDELVFDGVSFGLHADCSLAFQLRAFQEAIVTTHWQRHGGTWRCDDGPMVGGGRGRPRRLRGLRARPARLRQQERLPRRRARPVRRRQLRALRGAWRSTRSAPTACAA